MPRYSSLPPVAGAALGGLAAATIYLTGLSDGGFSPSSWGFAVALGLASCATLLAWRESIHLSWPQAAFAAGLVGLAGWTAVSLMWSADVTVGVQNTERDLAYALAGILGVLACWRGSGAALRVGLLVGSVAVCLVSLAARLSPQHFGYYSSVLSPGRLYYPLGYWNTQGLLAVFAAALCAAVVADRDHVVWRVVCAGLLPALAVDCYFTLSRGAIVALGVAVVVWLLVDPHRLRTSVWILLCAPAPLLAVWQAHRETTLLGSAYTLHSASAGQHLGLLVGLTGIVGAVVVCLGMVVEHHGVPRRVQTCYAAGALVVLAVAVGATFVTVGAPWTLAHKVHDALTTLPATNRADPSRVLSLSLSGRTMLWSVAWRDAKSHPVLGSGSGTYEQRWLRDRPYPADSRWAHNLYLETLAETGVVGLVLLTVALLVPVLAALKARNERFVPSLVGLYAAYLVHCIVDWDWQTPTVTLVALWAAAAILAADRRRRGREGASTPRDSSPVKRKAIRWVLATAVLGLTVVSALGLAGNRDLANAQSAAHRGDYASAEASALSATRWQPWSYLPWMALGEARQATGDRHGAASAYRAAITRDTQRWDAWFALAGVTSGAEGAAAIKTAHTLNPLSVQLIRFCRHSKSRGCDVVKP